MFLELGGKSKYLCSLAKFYFHSITHPTPEIVIKLVCVCCLIINGTDTIKEIWHLTLFQKLRASHVALVVKNSACQCRRCRRQGFDPRGEKIPWQKKWQLTSAFLSGESHREEPGRLPSTGSQTVGHDWSDWACMQPKFKFCIKEFPGNLNMRFQWINWWYSAKDTGFESVRSGCIDSCFHHHACNLGLIWFHFFIWFHKLPLLHLLLLSCFSRVRLCVTHGLQPTRLLRPWDSPGKNSGVGCHFLLQCIKVETESEVAQSCPTLATPWTAAYQAPPSMGFSRQEYWSGVPLPSPCLHLFLL